MGWRGARAKAPLISRQGPTEKFLNTPFTALLIEKDGDAVRSRLTTMRPEQLDSGEVTLRVHYSSITHKDALAATGAGKVIRRFPCVGGIDMSGEVVESTDPRFRSGDKVIATSFDIGAAKGAHCGDWRHRWRWRPRDQYALWIGVRGDSPDGQEDGRRILARTRREARATDIDSGSR